MTTHTGSKEITVRQLYERLRRKEHIQLVDVREPHEYDLCHLKNALHIPLEQLPSAYASIDRNLPIIIYCHHGIRSALAIEYLLKNHQFTNLFNLEGGIHAWAMEIDKRMLCY